MIGRQFSVLKTHILVHNYISSYCHCMLLADCLQNSPINDVRRFQAEIFTCMKYAALIPSSHWIISIHISITDHNSSPRGIGIPLPSTSLSLSVLRPFSMWTWVSRCLLKQRMMEVVATAGAIDRAKLQSNHYHEQTNTKSFLQAGCPSCRPTNSVKALKGNLPSTSLLRIRVTTNSQRDHSMLRYSRYKFNDWFSFCRPTALLPDEDTHEQSRQAGIHRAHPRSSIFVL